MAGKGLLESIFQKYHSIHSLGYNTQKCFIYLHDVVRCFRVNGTPSLNIAAINTLLLLYPTLNLPQVQLWLARSPGTIDICWDQHFLNVWIFTWWSSKICGMVCSWSRRRVSECWEFDIWKVDLYFKHQKGLAEQRWRASSTNSFNIGVQIVWKWDHDRDLMCLTLLLVMRTSLSSKILVWSSAWRQ